ncbi:MAG: hypothetical protein IJF84_13490 [Thermoguttaceae bacterium]|nr:hypothetical protein [Thermoguttaceae bacterium]
MYEIALISVALMAIANLLCFVILTDLIKEIDEMLRDIYRVTIKRQTIQEIAAKVEKEARELFESEARDCEVLRGVKELTFGTFEFESIEPVKENAK